MLIWASICGGIAVLHVIGHLISQEPDPEPIRIRVHD